MSKAAEQRQLTQTGLGLFALSDMKPTLHMETGCICFDFKILAIARKRREQFLALIWKN